MAAEEPAARRSLGRAEAAAAKARAPTKVLGCMMVGSEERGYDMERLQNSLLLGEVAQFIDYLLIRLTEKIPEITAPLGCVPHERCILCDVESSGWNIGDGIPVNA